MNHCLLPNDLIISAPQQTPFLLACWLWTIRTFLWGQLTTVLELHFPSVGTTFVSLGSKFAGVRRLLLHPMVHCEYSMLCLCVTGISHLDYHVLCRLFTRHTNLNDFWNSDLSSFSEDFLNGPVLWVSWRTVRTWDVTTALSCCSSNRP